MIFCRAFVGCGGMMGEENMAKSAALSSLADAADVCELISSALRGVQEPRSRYDAEPIVKAAADLLEDVSASISNAICALS